MTKDNVNKGPTYTNIPNKALEALMNRGLSNADIVVYMVLCKHYNDRDNQCWPSLNTIANFIGSDRSNVNKSIRNLGAAGMIYKTKTKSLNNSFERNSYYLPHLVTFQIEKLLTEKKSAATTRKIHELRELENYLLKAIDDHRGGVNNTTGVVNSTPAGVKKPNGGVKDTAGVGSGSATNTTINNTTINITKNVHPNNVHEDHPDGLEHLKRYNLKVSKESIGNSSTLNKIKREGLVQQLANELNDEKSIPYFRSIVFKLTDHEELIHKCLSLTRETKEITGIRKTRGAVFTDHIKREAEKLGIDL